MAVKNYKINFKSDFVLTVQCDAGWNLPFCVKFWTGAPSQSYFAGFDGTEYRNCRMGDTPDKLVVLFDDHHLPVGELKMQIAYHTTIEEFPTVEYDEVTNAQKVTTVLDGEEYHVMLDFTGETAPEIQFALPAYYNEQERQRVFAEMQEENAQAVQEAENVNAQLDGTILTVTNRNGISTSSNVQGPEGPQGPPGIGGEQSDWDETDPTAGSYIKNKPDIYTQQQTDQLLAGKQNVISDLATIRSNAEDGKQALTDVTAVEQLIPAAARPVNKLTDKEYVDTSLAGKQNVISDLATIRSNAEDGKQALTDVTAVGQLIPSTASAQNQLADKNFVNSSISTNTANFVGTYNSLAELQAVQNPTNNDYGFVIEQDAAGNEYYDRYKYVASSQQWLFEYKVESTPFTAAQWAAIQSGITSALVTKLTDLPTNAELQQALTLINNTLAGKANSADLAPVATSGSYNDLTDKPTIPTALSQLSQDSTHRVVSDTEKNTWNGKQAALVSGTNIKTINNESVLGSGNISISGGGGYTQTVVSGASITQTLSPNVFYSFGTVTSLTVSLGSPVSGMTNEYTFEFDSGSTPTTLSLPAAVQGIDATTIQANKHYEVSIKYDASNQNYYGLIQEW